MRIDKEKYEIFKDNFELTPQGFGFIEAWNFLAYPIGNNEGEPKISEAKHSFLEYLLINDKHQVIVDIVLHKIKKDGNEILK